MAKNAGKKQAPQVAETEANTEAKAPRKNVFLNGISDKMIHPAAKNGPAKDGKDWQRVGVSLPDGKVGNILVLPQQISQAQSFSRDKDTGATVSKPREGYSNILISGKMNVTLNEKGADGNYKTVEMTAEELKAQHEAAVKEFRAKAREASRETPEIKENEGAEAEAEIPGA